MFSSRNWLILPLVVTAIGFTCGLILSPRPPEPTEPAPVVIEDTWSHIGDHIDVSLVDWLGKPRSELAQLGLEYAETVAKQLEFSRHNEAATELVPNLHLAIHIPVFQEAKFLEAAGFSLPPYLKHGQKDAAVALHLARFGDLEVGRKLIDPSSAEVSATVAKLASDKNYPVEWTRLVALALYAAQFKLAGGGVDGATELVNLHKQLKEVLDSRAASGPLGAALLPLGRHVLAGAAKTWREPNFQKTALADDADAALAAWGEPAAVIPVLAARAGKAEIETFLGVAASGRTVAIEGTAALRGLDLLGLPLPGQGVEAFVAFLDGEEMLGELAVVYRARIGQAFPKPSDLAQGLVESGFAARDLASTEGVQRQAFQAAAQVCDVTLCNRSTAFGAVVRVAGPKAASGLTQLPRDARELGPVSLDATFSQNRLAVRPDQNGPTVETEDQPTLLKLARPKTDPAPVAAVLHKVQGYDLVASLTQRWPEDIGTVALKKLILPLWSLCGAARIEAVAAGDDNPAHLHLVWQDDLTRYTLRLPYDNQAPELVISDSRGPDTFPARAKAAVAFDVAQRKARFEAGKPHQRLPRSLLLDSVSLGMPRPKAVALLPRGQTVRTSQLADGVNLIFLSQPGTNATHAARQMFVRFGPGDTVAEVRVRYQIGPRQADKEHPGLMEVLRRGRVGAPDELPAPWAKLWTDLPAHKPGPVFYRWADDRTVMTYQRDAGGAEVSLRDCDADHADGQALPPLRFCSRGVDGCSLGDARAAVLRRWGIVNPVTTADGGVVLGQPESSPYDAVIVWFEEDKAVRIVAQHRRKGRELRPDNLTPALQEAWGRNIDRLGALRYQCGPWDQMYAAYGWNDDKTRVVLFAQDREEGPRLLTAWREWPVEPKAVAANP
jgi:hypothetical protein